MEPLKEQSSGAPQAGVVLHARSHRNKVLAAWLAFLFGGVGAHWWYLGHRRAWVVTGFALLCLLFSRLYPSWWDNPPFLLLIIPITAGFIEALILALKPDAWFDARYNADSGRVTQTGWGAVLVAALTTLGGGAVLMFWLAMIVMHVFEIMGWLDVTGY